MAEYRSMLLARDVVQIPEELFADSLAALSVSRPPAPHMEERIRERMVDMGFTEKQVQASFQEKHPNRVSCCYRLLRSQFEREEAHALAFSRAVSSSAETGGMPASSPSLMLQSQPENLQLLREVAEEYRPRNDVQDLQELPQEQEQEQAQLQQQQPQPQPQPQAGAGVSGLESGRVAASGAAVGNATNSAATAGSRAGARGDVAKASASPSKPSKRTGNRPRSASASRKSLVASAFAMFGRRGGDSSKDKSAGGHGRKVSLDSSVASLAAASSGNAQNAGSKGTALAAEFGSTGAFGGGGAAGMNRRKRSSVHNAETMRAKAMEALAAVQQRPGAGGAGQLVKAAVTGGTGLHHHLASFASVSSGTSTAATDDLAAEDVAPLDNRLSAQYVKMGSPAGTPTGTTAGGGKVQGMGDSGTSKASKAPRDGGVGGAGAVGTAPNAASASAPPRIVRGRFNSGTASSIPPRKMLERLLTGLQRANVACIKEGPWEVMCTAFADVDSEASATDGMAAPAMGALQQGNGTPPAIRTLRGGAAGGPPRAGAAASPAGPRGRRMSPPVSSLGMAPVEKRVVRFSVEVCQVYGFPNMFGVQFTRREGNLWKYKDVCQNITDELKLA